MSNSANPSLYKTVLDCSSEKPDLSCYIAIVLWLGWLFVLPVYFISLPILWIYSKTMFFYLIGPTFPLIMISAIYPISPNYQPQWTKALGRWIMNSAKRYFSLTVKIEEIELLEKTGVCLFALEPHDVIPVSIFWGSDYLNLVPNHKNIGCMTGILFQIPIIKHIYTWCSASSADRKNCMKLLSSGRSLTINPGGVSEVAHLGNKNERTLFLKTRFGFTKLALQTGASLVPVYTFGQDKCFDFHISDNTFLLKLGRKLGFLPMIFFGLYGIPLGPPKPVPLTVVVGKPIDVPKTDNPSNEEIEKYHFLLIKAVEKLYDDNKALYGCENIPLRIL